MDEAMTARDVSAGCRYYYRRSVRMFLVYVAETHGITSLVDITRDVMTAYCLHLQRAVSSRGGPYAASTLANVFLALRFFFGWLVKTDRLLIDPTGHLDPPRPSRLLPRPLKLGDVNALLRSVDKDGTGLRDAAMLELLYGTGMRRAEIARLTLADVDLEGRSILIREGKGRKDRLVPFGKKARAALMEYLEKTRPTLTRGKNDLVFLGKRGDGLSLNYITARVRLLGHRIGVKAGPHMLRHTCATQLLRGRADIRHIQRLLGHKSLQTTERYTKVEISDLRAVIQRCHPREKTTTPRG
jgi:integrase/recombinase XerD